MLSSFFGIHYLLQIYNKDRETIFKILKKYRPWSKIGRNENEEQVNMEKNKLGILEIKNVIIEIKIQHRG